MREKMLKLFEKSSLGNTMPNTLARVKSDKTEQIDNLIIKFFNLLDFVSSSGLFGVYPLSLADSVTTTNVVNPVNNVPDWTEYPKVIENVRQLGMYLSKFFLYSNYEKKDISINSWYRNEYVNQAVGGKKLSLHRLGAAVDLSPSNISEYNRFKCQLMGFVRNNQLLKVIFYDDRYFAHLELRNPYRG